MFKILRASGLIKVIRTNSSSIQTLKKKLNRKNNFWMLKEFVLISLIKPDARKTLNTILGFLKKHLPPIPNGAKQFTRRGVQCPTKVYMSYQVCISVIDRRFWCSRQTQNTWCIQQRTVLRSKDMKKLKLKEIKH